MGSLLRQLHRDGFALLPGAISPEVVASLTRSLEVSCSPELIARDGVPYASRELLAVVPEAIALLRSGPLAAALTSLASRKLDVVRALLFDKRPRANWPVPWHRDRTVVVRDAAGLSKVRSRHGALHAEASRRVLAQMLAVRVHLDAATAENGALILVPGSHRIAQRHLRESAEGSLVAAAPGDVLLMRPLVLHSSRRGTLNAHRRVLHFELAPRGLLAWQSWTPV